ncbi:MAG: hypothetical protein IJ214_11970, partial [Clostridia bacterium]|nr:hypothetical protein [Clostridia bacterium]
MLLTAIWNIRSTCEVYSADGYFFHTPMPSDNSIVLTVNKALAMLRARVFIIQDDPPDPLTA